MKKRLNIWLIKEGETLPVDENARLARMGILAEYLAERGHQVIWWSTTFIHGSKKYRCNEQKEIQVNKNEKLILLHSNVSYQRNTSLVRMRYQNILANEFARNTFKEKTPDVIVCSYPTAQFAREAEKYGKKYDVPVVVDVRDLWPDIFERILPKSVRWIAKIGLFPLIQQAKKVFIDADAITGIVPAFVEWALIKAGRSAGQLDQHIYIGYKRDIWNSKAEKKQALEKWDDFGVSKTTWNICFFGTMSLSSMDILTCIGATKKISKEYSDIRLILGGDGDGIEKYKVMAEGCKNIIFPGWLGKNEIHSLLEISKLGIYPCRNLQDFKNTFSNKIIGYMAAGLPVISDLTGFSKQYIEKYAVGLIYDENNVESCYKVIKEFYNNEEKRVKAAKNAASCFERDFSAEIVNEKYEEYLQKVVEEYKYNKKGKVIREE